MCFGGMAATVNGMMIAKRVILVAALLFSAGVAVEASPILFIVRHAEKAAPGRNDPELSAAGQERAEALGRVLKDAEITAIFTTEFKRTQETAAPTAKATQITPTIVPAKDIPGLVEKLHGLKGNALIVAHGNTIPDLVKELGIATPVNIPENDYSELLIIILGDKPQLLRLHYPN
jgi:2,3-bisphosphoglycerate-dependent phosphoglycerate mutase